jgi:ribosomal protein S12 methylthiotransferase
MQLQQGISLERNRRWHNRALTILVEGNGVTDDGHELIVGRSFREAPGIDGQVFAWGTAAQGTHARVHINHATEYDLWGEVAEIAHTAHTDDEPEYQHE